MGVKPAQRCPQCGNPVGRSDYQCPHCELMLEPDTAPAKNKARREVSVVRAMLERPRSKTDGAAPAGFARPPPGAIADAGRVRVPLDRVLEVSAPLRLQSLALHPYEAWVVSLLDGQLTGAALGEKLSLSPRELHGLLHGLLAQKAIALGPPAVDITQPVDVRAVTRDDATQLVDREALLEQAAGAGLSDRPSPKQTPPPRQRTDPHAPSSSRPSSRAVAAARPVDLQVNEPTVVRAPDDAAPAPKPHPRPSTGAAHPVRMPSRAVPATQARPPSRPTAPPRQVAGIEDLDPHGSLQVALQMEQADKLEEAVAYLERAIARSPDAAPLYNRLAVILMRDFEDFGRAEQLLEEALRLAPRHPVFARNLATVKQRQQEARRRRPR